MSSWFVFAAVLAAALMHASWNAVVKSGPDRLTGMAAVMLVSTFSAILLLPFVPIPHPASWPYIFLSTVIHTGYYFFLVEGYRHGDLNQVYPISRGGAPIIVAVGAWLAEGETLSILAMTGVVISSTGILLLAFEPGRGSFVNRRATLFGLVTALCIAGYTVTDGMGVRRAGDTLSYIAWLFAIEAWPLLLYVLWKKPTALRSQWRSMWGRWLGGGIASTLAYGIVIAAFSIAPMAMVSALRETSVIMAATIGALILKERFGKWRILAACVVVCGSVMVIIH